MSTNRTIRGLLFPPLRVKSLIRASLVALFAYLFFGHVCILLRIQGQSMEPTYHNGGVNFCWRLRYVLSTPKRHDVVAIEIHDPAEFELPRSGLVEVQNPETGVREIADLADGGTRRRLRSLADEQRRETKRGIRRSGIDQIELRTDTSYAAELAAFFGARARARRR